MLQNLLKLILSFLLNWVEGKLISHIWQCKIPPSSGSASFVLWSSNTCEPQWMASVTIVTHWLLTWPAQSAMISLGSDCSTDGEQSLHTSDAEIQKYNTFAGKHFVTSNDSSIKTINSLLNFRNCELESDVCLICHKMWIYW